MSKLLLRSVLSGILLLGLAALPVLAQPPVIPAGADPWVTPANGQTVFTFPDGDVEALCGAPPQAAWNHQVALTGIPTAGADYDTVVKRLDDAVFNASGVAVTRVQVAALAFRSLSTSNTPCGPIDWTVKLSGPQGITKMVIRRTSPRGGIFNADLSVSVEFVGTDANSGASIGSLFYSFTLPDPSSGTGAGTPWSFSLNDQFRAGMTETDNCINVLRQKLTQYATTSRHYYYISNMISQGRCTEQ